MNIDDKIKKIVLTIILIVLLISKFIPICMHYFPQKLEHIENIESMEILADNFNK